MLETIHDRSVARQSTRIGCRERTRRLSWTKSSTITARYKGAPFDPAKYACPVANPQQIKRRLLGRRRLHAARAA